MTTVPTPPTLAANVTATATLDALPAVSNNTSLPAEVMSFGTFKPVGHVLVGIPAGAHSLQLEQALRKAGFDVGLVWVSPRESADELQALVDNASPLAGFGYEITLMRRYVELSKSGHSWLLVAVENDQQAQRVGDAARASGATLAVRYGRLVVEELI